MGLKLSRLLGLGPVYFRGGVIIASFRDDGTESMVREDEADKGDVERSENGYTGF